MTAPDPGLTDLIAAHQLVSTDTIFHRNGMVQRPECKCGELMQWAGAYPAHLALVVEQHTNGQIAELEAELEKYRAEERRELEWARNRARDDVRCPSCNLRYGERDQYGCIEPARTHEYDADELRAALEGEQQ